MYFKQFYLGCLAHASYIIGADEMAAVIDPQRDVDQYIDAAESAGLQIRYVIETHLHADFVSGHRELADRTGARIVFGENAGAEFDYLPVKDGDRLELGRLSLEILSTPGHTPEGICILAEDSADAGAPPRLFTGDTLFIGDVGRPDLIGSKGFTAEQMASMLYDSLHSKIMKLSDDVEVYPAHGAGSLCGRNLSRETMSTIGEQRKFNYALQPMAKAAFVSMMTTDLPEVPTYFATDSEINRTGARPLPDATSVPPLSAEAVVELQRSGSLILDVRPSTAFGTAHIPGSLNIGLGGQFASWAGSLIPPTTPIVLVAEDDSGVVEAVTRLARVGLEAVKGYLDGGIYNWDRAGLGVVELPQMPVDELKARIDEGADLQILDVRRDAEFTAAHLPGAIHLGLARLEAGLDSVDSARPTAVICGSGYRSSAAASILERSGFSELYNVVGGNAAWVNAGYPTVPQQSPRLNDSRTWRETAVDAMDLIVLAAFAAVGLLLGVLGSGGSIVTLPVLVYLARLPVDESVATSLVIVGAVSLVGAVIYYWKGQRRLKVTAIVGLAGMIGAYFGSSLTGMVSGDTLLLIFSAVMLVVGATMLFGVRPRRGRGTSLARCSMIGLGVGVMTGFLGVGGGFLIVPALILFLGVGPRAAIASSLGIIALNSAAGVAGHLNSVDLQWSRIGVWLGVALLGMWAGTAVGSRVPEQQLRRAFAWSIIVVALAIAGSNLL